jgi:CheY-like chemotaxis protein
MVHHVLGIDDDAGQLAAIASICRSLGYHFTGVRTVEAALVALDTQTFCAVVSDLCVPFSGETPRLDTGYNFIERLRDKHARTALPVIAMTGHGEDHRYCTEAVQRGANDFSKKPIEEDWESLDKKLRRWIKECCVARHARCPNTPTSSGKGPRAKSGSRERDPSGPRITFDGSIDGRLERLVVDGDPCPIRPLSFKILCKLWIFKRRGGDGWVHATDLHRAANMPRVMGEVQADLKKRAGLEDVIEGDARKNYRLKLPVANFDVDRLAMKARHSQLLELLDSDA